jgi:ABC-2 type transport system permease protein
METALAHTWFMLGRQTRNLMRQPIWIALLLIQPLFWLLLYSQLFRRITELPGFGTTSYIQFLTPGIVIMTAFFSATWSGMAMIEDLDRGVIERFLATPARRSSLVLSQVLRSAITAAIQTVIILGIGFLLGARVHAGAGVVGWLVIILAGALVAACFSGISHGIALLARREETMIAVSNFIALPLMFLSSTLIALSLMPGWMQWAARFNPVNWGVVASREMVDAHADWASVGVHLGLLVAIAAATAAFATWSFRAYRRTL